MADQSGGDPRVQNSTPEVVARGLTEGRMLLVDVREPNEIAIERYPDAVVVPLSTFDPTAIPDPQGRQVVFACRSGRRSVTASLAAQEGVPLRRTSRRWHPGLEGRGSADRKLSVSPSTDREIRENHSDHRQHGCAHKQPGPRRAEGPWFALLPICC